MTIGEILDDNRKMVNRYLKPLLFNVEPIYVNAEYVTTSKGKEYIMITRDDNREIPIEVTGKSKPEMLKRVIDSLFEQ